MSLQFILWQSVFINGALPPPAFPTHLQCAKPRITSPPVCGGLPRPEGNVHEHRQVTALFTTGDQHPEHFPAQSEMFGELAE